MVQFIKIHYLAWPYVFVVTSYLALCVEFFAFAATYCVTARYVPVLLVRRYEGEGLAMGIIEAVFVVYNLIMPVFLPLPL